MLSRREKKVSNRELLVSARESDIDGEASMKADIMIRDQVRDIGSKLNNKIEKLEKEYHDKTEAVITKYNNMTIAYRGMVFFTLLYSTLTTIITACKTDVLLTDFMAFISAIKNGIIAVGVWISMISTFVARFGEMIPQEVVEVIVHWILVGIVYVGIIGGIGWLIFIFGRKYIKFFRDKQADEISVFSGLMILAIMIFMADIIKSILSINLICLMIIMFWGYTVIRGIVQTKNTVAKKKILKYGGIMVGCVVVMVVMGYFFGAIGIIAIPIGCLLTMSSN